MRDRVINSPGLGDAAGRRQTADIYADYGTPGIPVRAPIASISKGEECFSGSSIGDVLESVSRKFCELQMQMVAFKGQPAGMAVAEEIAVPRNASVERREN